MTKERLPALFVGHGSPMMALENDAYTRALGDFGRQAKDVEAIAVVSAHWEERVPIRITSAPRPGLIYDFYGFPREMYELTYPSPGKPDLAPKIAKTLEGAGFPAQPDGSRGLDHGCWVPLLHLFPQADIPVVQVSIPRPSAPTDLLKVGKALASLRSQGVLLVGSGNIVHNLPLAMTRRAPKEARPDAWAARFDGWFKERLEALDGLGATRYAQAPGGDLAVPTTEHYDPALVVMGAAGPGEAARHVFEGIYNANISMRCFSME